MAAENEIVRDQKLQLEQKDRDVRQQREELARQAGK